jgi:hypothetical protein
MCATRNRDFVHGLSCGTPIAFETAISTKRIRHANHRSHRFRKHSKLTSLSLYIKRATDALGKKESGKKRKWREPEARRGFYTSLLQDKVTSRRRSGKGPKRSWRCLLRTFEVYVAILTKCSIVRIVRDSLCCRTSY